MKPSINSTGPSRLLGGGVERPVPQRWALPFSGLSNRKPFKVGRRVMELPVETYCGGQAQGRSVRRPVSESSHPQPAFVFLTLFFFLPGYVAAQAKVYKFLPLRSAHCAGFRVFHDHSLPAGDSLMRFWVSTARPCLLFSTLDPRKNNTWLVPSLESPRLLGFAHQD